MILWIFNAVICAIIAILIWILSQPSDTASSDDSIENSGGGEVQRQTPKTSSRSIQNEATNDPTPENSGGGEVQRQTLKSSSRSVQNEATNNPTSGRTITFASGPVVQTHQEAGRQKIQSTVKPCKPVVPRQQEAPTFKDRQQLQERPIKIHEPEVPVQQAAVAFTGVPQQVPFKPCKPVIPVKKETSNSKDRQESYRNAFMEILTTLGLYNCKICVLDAIDIKKSSEHFELTDLPWIIIQKLFSIDFRVRDEVWSLVKTSVAGESPDGDSGNFDFFEEETISDNDNVANLSTLDVLVAIFTCCDNMLKQMLAEKLFVCKLAIPFMYPQGPDRNVVMSLWALRTITIHTNNKETNEITEIQVTEKPFPIVTFARLGRPQISKSKLMNDILRDSSHDTFFHHDCNNGTTPRRLTDGLVECSWFITAGKEKEHLPCTTMFLNLRGDGSAMEKQMQVLQKISSVVFIIVSYQDLARSSNAEVCKQIYHSGAKVILLLISGREENERETCADALGMDFLKSVHLIHNTHRGSQKNASKIKTEARKQLSEAIAECSWMAISKCAEFAAKNGIIIDEYVSNACREGRVLAENVLMHMEGKTMIDSKSMLLPLQGKEWLEYCKLKKKQHRASAKGTQSTSAHEAYQIQQKMINLRKEQAGIGNNNKLTPFVKEFKSTLRENQDVVLYFLKWLNMLLDEKSRDTLPGLRKEYHSLWGQFQEAKKKQDETDMKALKKQVDHAEHQLVSASIGLENLFRELGQLYEAMKESRKLVEEDLPEIAAKLLIKGIPLELIDGDASSVPIEWVKAVLTELEHIIGEKRLFILSVLGIQSSGKSTLLNTMFGLKFAVSAGRCTRGAYMQLVPVDNNDELPFDYIVVVDTEGLRAPELGQQKHEHDNELATLVIGLGDVTIVNIKGENTTEMKDTLQIAVHAFLRMNLVSKRTEDHRSCIFIHQNVPAANAEKLMMHGCQKLQEDLDDMAKEAAQSENISDILSFSQIIDFDVQKHVWYISDLWHGDPPMAPANPGYSEKVNAVRLSLLKDIAKGKTSFLTPSDFSLRLEDLWKGVLADDFVFSFRNSLEMKAYTSLQSKYFTLEFELQKCSECWFKKAEIVVKMRETIVDLNNAFTSQVADLSTVLREKTTEIKSRLDDYFEESNLKDVIIQWKQTKITQLEFAVQQYQQEGETDLLSVKEGRKVEIFQKQNWKDHETHVLKKSVELAKKFKGKQVSDFKLEEQFDSMWKPMVDDLLLQSADKEVRIDSVMESILFKRLGSIRSLLQNEIKRFPLHIQPTYTFVECSITEGDIVKEHFSLKKSWTKKLLSIVGLSDQESQAKSGIVALTGKILREISAKLKKQSSGNTQFLRPYAIEVVQTLVEKLDEYNQAAMSNDNIYFTILPTYYAKLAVHVSRHCVRVFTKMQLDYNKHHGVKAKLEVSKKKAWSIFKNLVKQSTEEVIAGDLLCAHLKDVIHEAVKKQIPPKVVEEVLGEFQMTKYNLIVKILDDLAHKNKFNDYASYIRNAKEFAFTWVTQYTDEKIFTTQSRSGMSRYAELAKSHITRIIKCVAESVEDATSKVMDQESKTTAQWIEHFCDSVSTEIAVPYSSLELMSAREVGNFINLQQIIMDQLNTKSHVDPGHVEQEDTSVQGFLENVFKSETKETIDWDGKSPSRQVIEKIWGCPEQCRFCKEPCADTANSHPKRNHVCVQHRPQGVSGRGWNGDGDIEGHKHSGDSLCIETCTYLVQCKDISFNCDNCGWHKYTEYNTCVKDWDIAPDPTNSGSKYWMWFMAKYKYELMKLHRRSKLHNIPESWNSITRDEALEDLRKYHN